MRIILKYGLGIAGWVLVAQYTNNLVALGVLLMIVSFEFDHLAKYHNNN